MSHFKIRNQYLYLFLILILFFGSASVYALYANFSLFRQNQQDELIREVYVTNEILEASLNDASKILDIVKPEIEKAINRGTLTDESASQILAKSHTVFSSFIANPIFQLSVYIDQNGMVRATNLGPQKTSIDLSDRLYFKTLINNPKLNYAVGNSVTARTTGLQVFHIAAPIIDKEGHFRGLITQQVSANEISKILSRALKNLIQSQIFVGLRSGDIAYTYPQFISQSDMYYHLHSNIEKQVPVEDGEVGVIFFSGNEEFPIPAYIGYATSKNYGLITTATIPKSRIFTDFLSAIKESLLFILVSFIILVLILWRFYKSTLILSESMDLSFTDVLTKLKNRRALDTDFPLLWRDSMRSQKPISLLFVDIDHFKLVNDNYGHEFGDLVLARVAGVISQCATRPLDKCYRWGGEEFVVVLPQTDESGAAVMAMQILDAVRAIRFTSPYDNIPPLAVSIGIASCVVTEANMTDDLIDMADKAMYMAKQSGRDRFVIFNRQNR